MKLVSVYLAFLYLFVISFSCTRDRIMDDEEECLSEVNYENQIRSIINASCAYNGCHLGGAAPGDFTTYEGLSDYFDGGRIETRVITQRNMPPANAPEGRPTELNESDINLLKCWIEADYPEK